MGHARLSIIDLEGGDQPIFNEDRSVSVILNGEIYNFVELRAWLLARGHVFRTRSDTEVIAHLWEEEQERCVHRLRGMFAFVVHDRKRRVLFGARDRFGQKPLFYHFEQGLFTFASEIKSLLMQPSVSREIDFQALDEFLFYQFVPHPRTMLRDVVQLAPGCSFRVQHGKLDVCRYWDLSFTPDTTQSDASHQQRIEASLRDSVRSHMVSDVPVGVFLSGGIDSSLVAALAQEHTSDPLRTFSIAFSDTKYDESQYARLASQHIGSDHQVYRFEPTDVAGRLEQQMQVFDQPLADSAALPLMMLSQHTSREVKVVLTGDGGDEMFAGYNKYRQAAGQQHWIGLWDRRFPKLFSSSRLARCQSDRLRLRKLRSRLAHRCLPASECSYFKRFWEGWDRRQLYQPHVADRVGSFRAIDVRVPRSAARLDPLNQMLAIDHAGYLPDDLLLKSDYATMAYGLEARAPLLDHHLAIEAARLPTHLKATPKRTKVVLRNIAHDLLPRQLIERPKHGFSVPLKSWFRNELQSWLRRTLLDDSHTVPSYFRPETVRNVLDQHAAGHKNHAQKIYTLLVFELWHRNYLERSHSRDRAA
jgi:asparagine synthase (glutamine-hydrolysing)